MEEIGIVKSIDGVTAKVAVERQSACDTCEQSSCHIMDNETEVEALNIAKAVPGQKVKISMKPYTYLKGTILIYGVPVIALIIGAILGKELLSSHFEGIDPDILSAIGGFSLLIFSFIVIRLITGRMEKKEKFQPVIEEILKSEVD